MSEILLYQFTQTREDILRDYGAETGVCAQNIEHRAWTHQK